MAEIETGNRFAVQKDGDWICVRGLAPQQRMTAAEAINLAAHLVQHAGGGLDDFHALHQALTGIAGVEAAAMVPRGAVDPSSEEPRRRR